MYLWWVSRRGGGGLVVMEDHHDEEPVAAAQVPGHPVHRVGVEDGGQDEQVDYNHHGGREQNNQSDKDLNEREKKSKTEPWDKKEEGEAEPPRCLTTPNQRVTLSTSQ